MIAVGLGAHAIHIIGLFALLLAAIVGAPRGGYAGERETSMVERGDPPGEEYRAARSTVLRYLRGYLRDHPDEESEAEDLADAAIMEALPRYRREGGVWGALVMATAKRRCLDGKRREKVTSAIADDFRHVAPTRTRSLDDDPEPTPEARDAATLAMLASPEAIAATRAATLAECRRRLERVTGADGLAWLAEVERDESSLSPRRLAEHDAARKASRDILKALEGAPPWLAERVDTGALCQYAADGPTWHTLTAGKFVVRYRDKSGHERVYGQTPAQAAVLSLLCGHWPEIKGKAAATPATVIRAEAGAIAKAILARSIAR